MAQCVATAKSTGQRCGSNAIQGATICRVHGANRHVRKRAAERVAMQNLMHEPLTDEERRHPWDIMIDALQRLDQVMVRAKFENGGAYVEHLERVVRASKALVDAKAVERVSIAKERSIEQEGRLVVEALQAAVEPLLDALPISPEDRVRYRQWCYGLAFAKLSDQPPPRLALVSADVIDVEVL